VIQLPIFFVKSEYLDKIEKGVKRIEVRIGENWRKLADGIREGKIKPIAVFKSGSKKVVMEIYKVEIHKNLKTALGNGKWKKMGLRAKTYHEAVIEVRSLYSRGGHGPTVLFWLRKLKQV
jgi:ASC-1-like (ASCH) protein